MSKCHQIINHSVSLTFRDLDKIDSLMQDITEQQEVAQEISDAISKPFGDQFDEVDITNRDVRYQVFQSRLQLPTI